MQYTICSFLFMSTLLLPAVAHAASQAPALAETRTILYHGDAIGSVRLTTAETGDVATAARYTPYGFTLTGQAEADETPGFAGKRALAMSGTHDFGARHYATTHSRFLSPDPIRSVDAANLYTYAMNNPLAYVDPDGRKDRPLYGSSLAQALGNRMLDYMRSNEPDFFEKEMENPYTNCSGRAHAGAALLGCDNLYGTGLQMFSDLTGILVPPAQWLQEPVTHIMPGRFLWVHVLPAGSAAEHHAQHRAIEQFIEELPQGTVVHFSHDDLHIHHVPMGHTGIMVKQRRVLWEVRAQIETAYAEPNVVMVALNEGDHQRFFDIDHFLWRTNDVGEKHYRNVMLTFTVIGRFTDPDNPNTLVATDQVPWDLSGIIPSWFNPKPPRAPRPARSPQFAR